MTKDFAKPSTTRKAPAKRKPKTAASRGKAERNKKAAPPPPAGKKKLIAGLLVLVCAFGWGLYSLQSIPPTHETSTPASPGKPANKSDTVKTTKEPAQKPEPDSRFQFYDILPESEIVAPKVDTYHFKEKNLDNNVYYIVQTGSFRHAKDAERQKALIAFQGLKANIKKIQNAEGSTWHRVETGPFFDRSEMNSALDKLVAIQIEPLVKKVKH